jgi:hypothetical protein
MVQRSHGFTVLGSAIPLNQGPTVIRFQGPMVRGAEEPRCKKGLCPDFASFGNGQVAGSRTTISPGTDCEL